MTAITQGHRLNFAALPRAALRTASRLAVVLVMISAAASWAGERPPSPVLQFHLITGGQIIGRMLSATDRSVVVDCDGFPCAFTYDRMLPDSACRTKFFVLSWTRGGRERLTAADHHALGLLALRHNRYTLAKRNFTAAARIDSTHRLLGDRALTEHRRRRRGDASATDDEPKEPVHSAFAGDRGPALDFSLPADLTDPALQELDESRRNRIINAYKKVGRELRERVGSDLVLLETPHFLIWTDWAKAEHSHLRAWCEQMYESLIARFSLPPDAPVFAGKCPVFCLRSRKRFRTVAHLLDDYDVTGALGYTSSDGNGHVHVVVCRQGGSDAARDAFAATLVHEGAHAFLHRYLTTRPLPPWINEGLAELVADAVLGQRCPSREAADAVAREIRRRDLSIQPLFADDHALEARWYPVAHSLVAFLLERDSARFVRWISSLKAGADAETALHEEFRLTFDDLERAWISAPR